MSDEHKTFKSKTIELFGSEYRVSHRANTNINSKFLITLGFVKRYFKIIEKYTFGPVVNYLSLLKSNYVFMGFLFMFLVYCGLIGLASFFATFSEINIRVNACYNGCELIDKYCSQYKYDEWKVLKVCIKENISFTWVFFDNFKKIFNFISCFLGCIVIAICVFAIMINAATIILNVLEWMYNKICKKIQEINQDIPDVEIV